MNPNKEARIQKLETETQQTKDKISKLDNKVILEKVDVGIKSY